MPGSEELSRILMVDLRSAAAIRCRSSRCCPKSGAEALLDDGTADDKQRTHSLVYRKLPMLSSALQISRCYGPQKNCIGLRHDLNDPTCALGGRKHRLQRA